MKKKLKCEVKPDGKHSVEEFKNLIKNTKRTDLSLEEFRAEVDSLINNHPIVKANAFTKWFSKGEFTLDQLRYFTVQFSVFSHLFIEAQLLKCINAPDLESYRAGKEILMNELGVTFTKDGTVQGGRFTFNAAHFEWLIDFAKHLGLHFEELGKRSFGTPSTLYFCDALKTWYGSADSSIAAGASHGIEHWAAAGFWKELIAGLEKIKEQQIPELPLGFWSWHDQVEDQHASHTSDELVACYQKPGFSQENFLKGTAAMLDAVAVFWNGLDADRKKQSAA